MENQNINRFSSQPFLFKPFPIGLISSYLKTTKDDWDLVMNALQLTVTYFHFLLARLSIHIWTLYSCILSSMMAMQYHALPQAVSPTWLLLHSAEAELQVENEDNFGLLILGWKKWKQGKWKGSTGCNSRTM